MIGIDSSPSAQSETLDRPFYSVYVVQALNGGPIKVGIAKSVMARVKSLQTAHPKILRPLAALFCTDRKAALKVERGLHKQLIAKGLAIGGEWFDERSIKVIKGMHEPSFDWSWKDRPVSGLRLPNGGWIGPGKRRDNHEGARQVKVEAKATQNEVIREASRRHEERMKQGIRLSKRQVGSSAARKPD